MSVIYADIPRYSARTTLKLGFLTPHNPHDRRAFSGTVSFAAEALARQSGLELRLLGQHRPPGLADRLLRRKSAPTRFENCEFDGLDAVIGLVASPLLDQLGKVRPDIPFLHVTDATPEFLRDSYGWSVPKEADAAEARVARLAAACVFSSATLAARAPDDLGLPGLLTTSQSFGVNLEALPDTPPGKPPLGRVNLLFVGIDWERKGGDIAVAALDELRALGVNAVLTIVGRCPVRHRGHPAIRAMGFLNKNRARDAARMRALYREAHLLLLPSRADCTPMVVAEAMAHGTPVLASEVGGIPEQIGGDGAGQVLPLFTSPAEWARTIAAMTVPDRYAWMSDAAFDRAQSQLNWDVWATRIADLARRAAQGHVPLPLERGTNAALAQN